MAQELEQQVGALPVGTTKEMGKDSPADLNAATTDMRKEIKISRDIYGGNRTVKAEEETYLPKNPKEESTPYKARLARTPFFNAYKKTVKGLTGMAFRKPATLETTNKELEEHMDNVDMAGSDVWKFAMDVFEGGITDGGMLIIVDMASSAGIATLAQERESGKRPYWIPIRAENVLNWRSENRAGKLVLTQITVRIDVEEPNGDFACKEFSEYRVFTETYWQRWRHPVVKGNEDKSKVVLLEAEVHTLGEVPAVLFNANPEAFFRHRPPLMDLVYENIGHFQLRSDYLNNLHYASVGVLALSGVDPPTLGEDTKEVVWGSDSVLYLPESAKAWFVEHQGKATGASKDELQAIEERMARMGLALLAAQDADVKATKLRFDKAENDAPLVFMVQELSKAMNGALEMHKKWLGIKDDSEYVPNKDFTPEPYSAEEIKTLSALVGAGQLSLETMWTLLKAGETLPDDFDAKEEQTRLANEGANLETETGTEEEDEEEPEPENEADQQTQED